MISIIVPVYNVEPYLKKCLQSLVRQTYKEIEIILVDDGSTDNSGKICDEYAANDSRITVIHKNNGGLMTAWKQGLESANSELIMFVDSDDWVEECIVEVLYENQKRSNADIVCCSYYHEFPSNSIPDDHKVQSGLYHKQDYYDKIFPVLINDGNVLSRGIRISRWGKLIKKNLLLSNLKWTDNRITIGEDMNIILPSIIESDSILILNEEYLYHYRANEESMMKKVSPRMFEQVSLLFEKEREIASYYQALFNFVPQIEKDFCDLSINIFMKEYKQNGTFGNYWNARRSKYQFVLKQMTELKRYSGKKKVFAILLKSNYIVSFILVLSMKVFRHLSCFENHNNK